MKKSINIKPKVEILQNRRSIVSAKKLLSIMETKPEKIDKIRFINPKIGSKSLGNFFVEYEW